MREPSRSAEAQIVIPLPESQTFARQAALSIALISAVWIVAIAHWIGKERRRTLGSQKSVLRLLSLPVRNAAGRQVAVLESVPLWRASERRRPTIIDFFARLRGVGRPRCVAHDAGLRCRRPGASPDRWHRHGLHRSASRLAGRELVCCRDLFMFGGPASARLQHTGIILSYSTFPLALLLLQLALDRRSYTLLSVSR